jgi:ubiquitin-conjugating enzyme E2 O
VGEVIGASGGFIRVAWGDGSVSNCHPKFAWVVSHDDDDSDSELSTEDEFESGDESDASWETLGEERADTLENLAPAFAATRDGPDAETRNPEIPRRDDSSPGTPGTSIASPLGVRRGVPEAAPSLTGPPGGFSGSAALDPIARAYVERRREEAEFGWLAEHARRSGASEPSSNASNALNASNASNANGSSSLTPQEASRAAAALAAAFSGLRSAGAPETSTPRLATSEAANETSDVENLASSRSVVEKEEEEEEKEKEEEEEEEEACFAKNEETTKEAFHPRTNDEPLFPAFASVDIDDEDVDAALDDHRFKETPATGPADLPAWSKAVRKEWRTLRTSLPANVWVRVFEQRTDVLRAAMLGPEGTPYHDNVFVFDFSFPPGYPNEPPASSYHSRGERVNPNLYENGKVCLSLLSTWSGKGSEMWDPKRSNMLQVLVSIQGLVLVDDPYYNEAGYEKQSGTAEGKRNGDQYNEQAFLASARSMISTVRDPPRHFEPLIRAHFHAKAPKILRVCRAYLEEGCPIGQYDARLLAGDNAKTGGSGTTDGKADAAAAAEPEAFSRDASGEASGVSGASDECSGSEKKAPSRPPPTEGFKLTLRKLVPRLEAAFKANDELVAASERAERART